MGEKDCLPSTFPLHVPDFQKNKLVDLGNKMWINSILNSKIQSAEAKELLHTLVVSSAYISTVSQRVFTLLRLLGKDVAQTSFAALDFASRSYLEVLLGPGVGFRLWHVNTFELDDRIN